MFPFFHFVYTGYQDIYQNQYVLTNATQDKITTRVLQLTIIQGESAAR